MTGFPAFGDGIGEFRSWQQGPDIAHETVEEYKIGALYGKLLYHEVESCDFRVWREFEKLLDIHDLRMRDALLKLVVERYKRIPSLQTALGYCAIFRAPIMFENKSTMDA